MTKVSTTATQKLQTQKMEIDFELQKISMGIDCRTGYCDHLETYHKIEKRQIC